MRQWVEAHPGLINAEDYANDSSLSSLVRPGNKNPNPVPLALWLLEKGADITHSNAAKGGLLHRVRRLDLLNVFLPHGANPTVRDHPERTPLITHVQNELIELVARLLEDSRVRATLHAQTNSCWTAIHYAVDIHDEDVSTAMVRLLLAASAEPDSPNDRGAMPLDYLCSYHPEHHSTIALIKQAKEEAEEKASLLIKARRLSSVLSTTTSTSAVVPSYFQRRLAQGLPLPRLVLATGYVDDEREQKLCALMGFVLGMEGGSKGQGMPPEVYRLVLALVMLAWDGRRSGVDGGQRRG